jgi:hypothetical protein
MTMADNFPRSFRSGLGDLPIEPPDEFIISYPFGVSPQGMRPPNARSGAQVDAGPLSLERAEREHEKRGAAIQAQRDALERRAQDEEARWLRLKEKLKSRGGIAAAKKIQPA